MVDDLNNFVEGFSPMRNVAEWIYFILFFIWAPLNIKYLIDREREMRKGRESRWQKYIGLIR